MTKLQLYYRPPNRDKHLLITDALDEIYKRLEQIEQQIDKSAPFCDLEVKSPPIIEKQSLFSRLFKKWL